MIDLLRTKATHSRLSELVYIGFNAMLPIAVLLLARLDPPYLAILLVVLSKWRIFALRPRFWWTNIKANMADLVVGISTVGLLYLASASLPLQIVLAIAYAVWLLGIKPRSGVKGTTLQAGIAQCAGLVTLFHFSVLLPEIVVLLGCWLIGYVAARHFISNYEEPYIEVLAAAWGLFVAELGWLMYRWTTVYNLGIPIRIPQIALIMLVIGFCAARMYHIRQHGRMTPAVLRGTVFFGLGLLLVIIFFSSWDITV